MNPSKQDHILAQIQTLVGQLADEKIDMSGGNVTGCGRINPQIVYYNQCPPIHATQIEFSDGNSVIVAIY